MAKSIKRNFLYNIFLNVSSVIFPLVTAPYVARVLEPDGVGLFNFSQTYAGYFTLFALIGIPTYGVREVSKLRGDKVALSRLISELMSIAALTTVVVSLIYIATIGMVCQLSENYLIFLLAGFGIYLAPFKVNWYYQGIEEFGYITFRTLVIRVISLICLFIFVHNKNDLVIYVILNVLGNIVADIWNFIKMRESGIRPRFTTKGLKKHLHPLFLLFASSIAISIYAVLDTLMLGFMKSYVEVGYYTNAAHIAKLFLSIVTSLSVVSVPRFSYYFESKQLSEANDLMNKSFSFVAFLAFPLSFGIMCLSPVFVPWFFGQQFEAARFPLMILSLLPIAIGFSNIAGIQVLVGMGRDKIFLICIIIGAITNFSLNCFLIPLAGAIGASIASVIAEFVITGAMCYSILKFTPMTISIKSDMLKSFSGALLFFPIVTIIPHSVYPIVNIIICVTSCAIVYFLIQLILHNGSLFLFQYSVLKKLRIK